jgi:hypothetical protein
MFRKDPPAPKMSRTKAINEKCKDCIYDHAAPGTWREQVELCTSQSCALWQHRPITVATMNLQRKGKDVGGLDTAALDALVAGLEDEEEDDVPESVA